MKAKPNNVQTEHISDSKLIQAGFAQCIFIVIQTLVFPELGFLGCIIAAQCALIPWLLPIARQALVTAVAMSLTSIVISPLFYLVCLHTMDSIKELIGPTVNQLTLHFVDILKTYLRVTHD